MAARGIVSNSNIHLMEYSMKAEQNVSAMYKKTGKQPEGLMTGVPSRDTLRVPTAVISRPSGSTFSSSKRPTCHKWQKKPQVTLLWHHSLTVKPWKIRVWNQPETAEQKHFNTALFRKASSEKCKLLLIMQKTDAWREKLCYAIIDLPRCQTQGIRSTSLRRRKIHTG